MVVQDVALLPKNDLIGRPVELFERQLARIFPVNVNKSLLEQLPAGLEFVVDYTVCASAEKGLLYVG
jgi:hypothetical protein